MIGKRGTVDFIVYWRFKEFHEYEITKCKKIINTKTNTLVKYNRRGFYIKGRYLKRHELNPLIEVIPKDDSCPF